MSLTVTIKVSPGARVVRWQLYGEGLKCSVKSPPEQGKANRELIELIANAVRVPIQDVTIIAGATSRTKQVRINKEITFNQLCAALNIDQPQKLFK